MNPDSSLPVVTRRSDGKRFRIVLQARSFDGPVSLTACDGPPFENVETSGEAFARDFDDPRKAAPAAAKPEPVLCYGSDNAGGVVLWVGEERVRLDAARVAALIEGLRREAALPPSLPPRAFASLGGGPVANADAFRPPAHNPGARGITTEPNRR